MARVMACSPEFQAGDWVVSRHASWSGPLIQQLLAFPNASHDDMVDAVSQAAIWLQEHAFSGTPPPFEVGEPSYSIQSLRDYLRGGAPPQVSAETSAAVINGCVTPQMEDEILGSTIPGGLN